MTEAGQPIQSSLDHIYRSDELDQCTISKKLENSSTDHVPIMISIIDKKSTNSINKVTKRCMKNFSTSYWNETLSSFNFSTQTEKLDINILANELADSVTQALDIVAPKKTVTIRQKYIHGLTEEAKEIMKSRDYVRSQLKQSLCE